MATKFQKSNHDYLPDYGDLVIFSFEPSTGHEVNKRRPALVLSPAGYSKATNLTIIVPITHATNNQLSELMIPIPASIEGVDGYINPLQIYSFDSRKRHIQSLNQKIDGVTYAAVRDSLKVLLNI